MLITKEQCLEKQNASSCTVREYPFPTENIGRATTKINGRYPSTGKVVNKACDLVYYIISGTGNIETEAGVYMIKQGDGVFLEKGKPYSVVGENLFIGLSSSPARYPEQYEEIISGYSLRFGEKGFAE